VLVPERERETGYYISLDNVTVCGAGRKRRVAGTYRRGARMCPRASAAPTLLIFAGFVGGQVIPSFSSLAVLIGALGATRFCRLLQVVRG
jgi:hypothetical protein